MTLKVSYRQMVLSQNYSTLLPQGSNNILLAFLYELVNIYKDSKVLITGLLAILSTTFCMAQINEKTLSDELCDKLCAAAREKSKELGVDISFDIADSHGLPRVFRRYGDALVLSITLVPGKAYTAAVTQCKTKDVAAAADEKARERRERMPGNRALRPDVVREALGLLKSEDWSPCQISGYMRLRGRRISHESIYSLIRSDESGELRGHCRHRMRYRHHVKVRRKTAVRNIPGRVSIHERPPEADGRRFGDWEMDLIVGKGRKSAILTLCERSRNYMM